jgi:catechol 1,2-dioxygenase
MKDLKSLLIYIIGLAGLVMVALALTSRMEVEFRPLPSPTPPVQDTPSAVLTEVAQQDCATAPPSAGLNTYISDVPFTSTLAPPDLEGIRLIVSGTVYASDKRTPVPGALLEVWHADAQGQYDHTPPFSLRARMRTDTAGRFEFSTVRPGRVQVGCEFLPAHINYLVSYLDYRPLFTSQFFADDSSLAEYPPMRPVVITSLVEEERDGLSVWYGVFDIVLPVPAPGAASSRFLTSE